MTKGGNTSSHSFSIHSGSRLLLAFPLGEGGPRQRCSGALVNGALETISLLSFIPLVPYPARSARHLPHAGKALFRKYRYPHPTSAPSGHLLPEEGECRLPYSKSFFPASSFRAKARNLFRLRLGKGCEECGEREACFMRLGSTVFHADGFTKENGNGKRKRSLGCARDDEMRKCLCPFLFILLS